MEEFINPSEYIEKERQRLTEERDKQKGKHPAQPEQDVLMFLIENAPLERWERAILSIIRDEGYYFVPQMQTKIMNEGWASYWHSRLMTEEVCDWSEIVDYADNNAAVTCAGSGSDSDRSSRINSPNCRRRRAITASLSASQATQSTVPTRSGS